ncbi:NADH-ubiquinone oxidoreductase chain J [hydrothermal vent metagenome]|uniref:NADH-ubiquinone oxidoreductase chain J n=1 Tax=hydrothermal vent metagenome TaxID=652676 RepID=A0A3B0SYN1_9ZZZZ
MQIFAFYLFATIVIASGAFCIFARNPVHSVLWLILAFFNAAGLMLLVGAEFIAALLVIVYVGAVAVLFLFVVMMLDIDFAELRAGFMKNLPLGLLLAFVLLAEIIFGVGAWSAAGTGEATAVVGPAQGAPSNIEQLGAVLYTKYIFLFEAAGLILLVAMVGAIVLTHRKRGGVRIQNINEQVNRRPADATRNTQPEVGKGVEL